MYKVETVKLSYAAHVTYILQDNIIRVYILLTLEMPHPQI